MKRTKKSQKKTKILLLLIVLTAILSITATYAWFSTQKDVEISTMRLNIEVAESLQISLDGETWTNSIEIQNMRQFYGTYGVDTTHQAVSGDNTNYVPTELLPVSTTGAVSGGKLQFMKAKSVSGKTMVAEDCTENIGATDAVATRQTDNKNHPYLVFDMYLNNISKQTNDPLRLNKGSKVWVDDDFDDVDAGKGTEGTGLENCVRVAFVPYEDKAIDSATATGEGVRDIDGSTSARTTALIWEPNHLEHTPTALANTTRTIPKDGEGNINAAVATYGIIFNSDADVTIDNTDADAAISSKTAAQTVLTPTYDASGTTAVQALGVNLPPNKITKVRTYVWIEGQDIDCINTASMGGMLQVKLRLEKEDKGGGSSVTYDGTGPSATPTPTATSTP